MELAKKHCVPCEGGIPPLSEGREEELLKEIRGWELVREGTHKLRKEFTFKDFKEAMDFVNRVAEIAEQEGHHPNICIFYNKVKLELWTHAIGGLHENDFVLAAKIEETLKS